MGIFSEKEKLVAIQKKNRPRGRPKKVQYIFVPNNMEFLKRIEDLKLDGNLAENWRVFSQNWEQFAAAIEFNKKDELAKIGIFLNEAGTRAIELFHSSLVLSEVQKKKFDDVYKAFEKFCLPKKNEMYESFLFLSRNQREGEKFDSFLIDIKKLVKSCGYDTQNDRMLRDRIVLGINNKKLQKRMLEVDALTLEKAIEMARAEEISNLQSTTLQTFQQRDILTAEVCAVNRNFSKQKHKEIIDKNKNKSFLANKNVKPVNINQIKCKFCNQIHEYGKCSAFGKTCTKCKKRNHLAICCYSKTVSEICKSSDQTDNCFYIDTIDKSKYNIKNSWFEKISVNGKILDLKLDTGAEYNVMPFEIVKKLKNVELRKTDLILVAYGGNRLNLVGEVVLECCFKNEISFEKFAVVKGDAIPIFGLQGCLNLKLVKRLDSLQMWSKEKILKDYKMNFEGLGCFVDDFKIELKENVVSVAKPPRRVPLSLIKPLKSELDRLEKLKIIEKTNGPADWISNLVIVEKSNGNIRLCLDPQDLNRSIKDESVLIPKFDDVISKISGKKYFSVLDNKEGFFQIKLDENSSKLCTFNSPFGCYKFLRLPFGIKIAPEAFQKCNEMNFEGIDGIAIYIDDILIFSDTVEEHNKIMKKVMERAKEKNIKFNKDKFQFQQTEVKFLGHKISQFGISFDDNRIRAIEELGTPKNKKDVQKLLGMVNYLQKTIPNLADISTPLRELLKKDVVFNWYPNHDSCLKEIKNLIVQAPKLKPFDPSLDIVIQTDASKSGVGCCLLQGGSPISFASKSLTETEIRYSQIEKEMLAICYACEKFHNWVYGRDFLVQTDHKPLLGIVNKPVNKIPSGKLQRMKMKLWKYKIKLEYLPGSRMFIADLLSRDYIKDEETDTIAGLDGLVHSINVSEEKMLKFQEETDRDSVMSELKKIILEGWPKFKKMLPENVKSFWKFKENLFLENNIIFFDDRLLVPASLRSYILEILHKPHFGIEKTKMRAREIVYWPGLMTDIENMIEKCNICQQFRPNQRREPLLSHEIPLYPFMKIGMDIFEFKGKDFLVVVDYYSKFIDIKSLGRKTASCVINVLKPIFAVHGLPKEIIADNVPFGSYEFRSFMKKYDIEVKTTSPLYPQSNGMSERAVQIAKNILKRSVSDDYWLSLLEYRNTVIKDLELSPNQLLLGRKTRSQLPEKLSQFKIKSVPNLKNNFDYKNKQSAKYYNRNVKKESVFTKGEQIWFKNGNTWAQAIIIEKDSSPRSYWIKVINNGKILRRTTYFLRKERKNC